MDFISKIFSSNIAEPVEATGNVIDNLLDENEQLTGLK
mgnify:CR=1 FL=1